MEFPKDLVFLQWLIDECGYLHPRPIGAGRYTCIIKKMFTHAIVTGVIGDKVNVENNWCYPTYSTAKQALDAWDGQGEPTGWNRHPATGRRISTDPQERDDSGNRVPVGQMYVRS